MPAAVCPGIFTQAVHSRASGYLPSTGASERLFCMQLLTCNAAAAQLDRTKHPIALKPMAQSRWPLYN